MDNQYTIQEELKELKSCLPYNKEELYAVPNGYFENLASSILNKIKAEDNSAGSSQEELEFLSPLLSAIPRKMPFSVPEGYFNQNIGNLNNIVQEDILPQELIAINRATPYTVPAGYFEKLPQEILAKVAKPQAKVVSFNRTSWTRYAAAAIVIGFVAITGFYFFKSNTPSADPGKDQHEWVASKLKNVSTQDLEEFIKNTGTGLNDLHQVAKSSNNHKEVHKLVHDIPTSEINAFLSEIPAESDASTLN